MRATLDERAHIRAKAAEAGLDVSEYLRRLVPGLSDVTAAEREAAARAKRST